MFVFMISVHVIVSLFLVFVILIQSGRGGGLSQEFGGSSTQTILGTKTATFLTRTTTVCAALYIITSLSLAIMSAKRGKSLMEFTPPEPVPFAAQQALPTPEIEEAPETVQPDQEDD